MNPIFAQNFAALILFLLAFGLSLWVCLTTPKDWVFEDSVVLGHEDDAIIGANFRRFCTIAFAILLTHISVALFHP